MIFTDNLVCVKYKIQVYNLANPVYCVQLAKSHKADKGANLYTVYGFLQKPGIRYGSFNKKSTGQVTRTCIVVKLDQNQVYACNERFLQTYKGNG